MFKILPSILLKNALIIFALEALIMLYLPGLNIGSTLLESLADALSLTAISSLLIYLWVLKPYVLERDSANANATAATQLNEHLMLQHRIMDDLINGLPGIFYLLDDQGYLIRWNRRMEEVTGYSAAELERKLALEFFDEENRPLVVKKMMEVLEKDSSSLETNFVPRDGRQIPYLFEGHRISLNNRPHISGLGVDMTENKQLLAALHKSERHFATLLSASPVGMFETDHTGNLTYINERFSEITGLSYESVKGIHWGNALHPEDRDMVIAEWLSAVAKQHPFYLDWRFIDDAGHITWVLGQAEIFHLDSGEVQGYIGTITDITEKKKSENVMWRQANFDLLTGLPNRLLFFDRLSKTLSQARRSGKHAALLYLDLDGFKPVNDDFGHLAGDAVLKKVGQRWLACARAADTLARMGGDEFAIILGDLDSPDEAAAVAEKLLRALSRKITLPEGQECTIGASIGISIYPQDGTEMDSLLASADIAMYESKAKGKNTFTFHNSTCSLTSDEPGCECPNEENWIMFDSSHLVGITEIDDQHNELICMVNRLNLALRNNEDDQVIVNMFNKVIEYAVFHFQTEHRLMEQYHYPGMEAHDKEHDHLAGEVVRLTAQLHQGRELLTLQAIKDWLMNHINTDDKYLGAYLQKQRKAKPTKA